MELKYIIAIAAGGVFMVMLIAFIVLFFIRRSQKLVLSAALSAVYSDPELSKMEYDFAPYDEETKKILSAVKEEGQMSIEDFIGGADDIEGIEEITGNYKPE